MRSLNADVISQIEAKSLFSREEEDLLCTVTPVRTRHVLLLLKNVTVASKVVVLISLKGSSQVNQPTEATFATLLRDNATRFHPMRTAKHLFKHWAMMKQYHLLPQQSVQPMPRGDHVLNFSDAEDLVNDDHLT